MGRLIKWLVLLTFFGVVLLVVGVAGLGYVASSGKTSECPEVKATGKTAQQVGNALDSSGSVQITNGDATSIGNEWVGAVVDDLRVCFDSKGGHASGKLALGPISIPFYVSGEGADLTGTSPRVYGLTFELGGLPEAVIGPAKSMITGLIDDNMGRINLSRRYDYSLGDGSVTIRSR